VRQHEQSLDTARRKTRLQDEDVRQREQSLNTARHKTRRQAGDVRQREQSLDTARRKARRQNDDIRQQEQVANTTRKQSLRDSTSLPSLIHRFHSIVAHGPVYICSSCDQLLYRHSVQLAANTCSASSISDSVLLNKCSSDGIEYICNTCSNYLRKNKIPPCAIVNNLHFPVVPTHLPILNMAEWRTLSPRLAFMQIREAVVGKQLRIHGNVVCVPADVCTTVSTLPRTSSNFETVAVQLKRRSQYQHAFLTSNIRPACIREVGTYLVEHGELFQLQNITFSHSELEAIEPDALLTVSHASDDAFVTDETVTTNVSTLPTCDSSASVDVGQDSDPWVEIADMHVDRPGVFDTLFSSPDFVEDSERAAVYGQIDTGNFDHVHTFAPTEGNKPISVFVDKYSEELSFPNIFWGSPRPDSHPVKVHYSDIVKSELRHSDRRCATCIENIFYKLKNVRCKLLREKLT